MSSPLGSQGVRVVDPLLLTPHSLFQTKKANFTWNIVAEEGGQLISEVPWRDLSHLRSSRGHSQIYCILKGECGMYSSSHNIRQRIPGFQVLDTGVLIVLDVILRGAQCQNTGVRGCSDLRCSDVELLCKQLPVYIIICMVQPLCSQITQKVVKHQFTTRVRT